MPTGTLPNSGALGDSQVTTGDYQTQINQLLSYVRSLKAEVDALSGTEIKEGAVRGVGGSLGDLYAKGEISSTTVFSDSGGKQFLDYSDLSDSSEGWYIVQHSDMWTMVYIGVAYGPTDYEYSAMAKLTMTTTPPYNFTYTTIRIFGSQISSLTQQYDATNEVTNTIINKIYKVVKV